MRNVTLIVVHCSANKAGSALRAADIDRYHRSLGWKGCGYHYVIPTDGTIEAGRDEMKHAGAAGGLAEVAGAAAQEVSQGGHRGAQGLGQPQGLPVL